MDKRRRPRKKTRLPARFGGDKPEKLALITDVSTRGIYLSTNAVMKSGSTVYVQVRVPNGEPISLKGRVVRGKRVAATLVMLASGGMGVVLEDPPPGWRESLSLPEEG